jgi:hypothetical protein
MKRNVIVILLSLIFAATISNELTAADFKKGQWELTYTTTMEGMPIAMPIPVRTEQQCIDTDEFVPESCQDGNCSHSSKKAASNRIEWNVNCSDNSMTGKGVMEFSGETMNGNMEMKMGMMDQKISMKVVIEGKYLGACK